MVGMKSQIIAIGVMMLTQTASDAQGANDMVGKPQDPVQDMEGNSYRTVKIGNQIWLADNLRATKFQDASKINTAFIPDKDEGSLATYGRLYGWHDVTDARNLCPVGWRVASDEDWKALERALGMGEEDLGETGWRGDDDIALMLKAAQPNARLKSFDQSRVNQARFNATAAGIKWKRWYLTQGMYSEFWTSSESTSKKAFNRTLAYSWWNSNVGKIYRTSLSKTYMFSVRCVKE